MCITSLYGRCYGTECVAGQNLYIAAEMEICGNVVKTPLVSLYCNLMHISILKRILTTLARSGLKRI